MLMEKVRELCKNDRNLERTFAKIISSPMEAVEFVIGYKPDRIHSHMDFLNQGFDWYSVHNLNSGFLIFKDGNFKVVIGKAGISDWGSAYDLLMALYPVLRYTFEGFGGEVDNMLDRLGFVMDNELFRKEMTVKLKKKYEAFKL